MSVMISEDQNDLVLDCDCGCDNGIRIRVDRDDSDYYFFISYICGNFYRDREDTFKFVLKKKLKRIWSIIRNKDYHCFDMCINKDDFLKFKEYIAGID